MRRLLDAFWRATAYCLHPKVVLWSLLPLLLAGGSTLLLGWFYWELAVAGVRGWLEGWSLVAAGLQWLDSIGGASFRAMLAPLLVVAMAVPVIVVASLLLVALLMTPALVDLVAARRFPTLERRRGARWWQSVPWTLGCSVLALLALAVTMPLWLIPPFVLVLPPLIWGWLTTKVMAFDVLADHADGAERQQLMREHRWPLLAMGLVAGYLGAAPSLVWAFSALTLVFAPVLVALSVWLYTLVFAFSALWFAHYALDALAAHRAAAAAKPQPAAPPQDAPTGMPAQGMAALPPASAPLPPALTRPPDAA